MSRCDHQSEESNHHDQARENPGDKDEDKRPRNRLISTQKLEKIISIMVTKKGNIKKPKTNVKEFMNHGNIGVGSSITIIMKENQSIPKVITSSIVGIISKGEIKEIGDRITVLERMNEVEDPSENQMGKGVKVAQVINDVTVSSIGKTKSFSNIAIPSRLNSLKGVGRANKNGFNTVKM